MKKIPLLIATAIVFIGCLATLLYYNNQDKAVFIKTLKSPDGTNLGDMYATHLRSFRPSSEELDQNVFTSLYVLKDNAGKKEVIYRVDSSGLYNSLGKDSNVSQHKFFGYQLEYVKSDNFSLHLLGDNGKNISDSIRVYWNDNKKVFEVERPNFEEGSQLESATLGTLKISTKEKDVGYSILGWYLDKSKNILDSLVVIKKFHAGTAGVYTINKDGFRKPVPSEYFSCPECYDKKTTQDAFHGFRLSSIGDDYITVFFVDGAGQRNSGNITVKWNTDKGIFEAI